MNAIPADLRDRRLWILPTLAAVLLGTAGAGTSLPRPDTTWLLHVTGRVLDGARLGVDIVDVTPPVILWLKAPAVLLSRVTGWDAWTVWTIGVAALGIAALIASGRLIRRVPSLASAAPPLLAVLAIGLFLLPRIEFGQREHVAICFAVPWLLAVAARAEGQALPRWTVWGLALLAGLGLALKPHFALVWLAVAGTLAWTERRWRAFLAPELAGAAMVPLLAIVATLILHPGYFEYAREFGSLYTSFARENPILVGLVGEGAEWSWLGLLALLAFTPAIGRWPASLALLLAALAGFHVGAAAQMKGWEYHFLPAGVLGLFLAAGAGACARWPADSIARRVYGVAVPVGIAVAACIGGWRAIELMAWPESRWAEADPNLPALLGEVRRSGRRERLLVVSTNIGSGWPLAHMAPADWTLRGPAAWLLAAIYASDLEAPGVVRTRSPANWTEAERQMADEIEEDVALRPPTMIIVPRATEAARPWELLFRFDYLTILPDSVPGVGPDSRWTADTIGDYLVYRIGGS